MQRIARQRGDAMLPTAFQERMRRLLGEEYDRFAHALSEDAVRGFRINPIKADRGIVDGLSEFSPIPLPYVKDGYRFCGERIGNTPYHHAGAIYVQDPGAMSALCAVNVAPDWRVADLCAAPGGKSAQIAAQLGAEGFLLSNEYVPARAKITVGNFERLGVRGAVVTSMDTATIATLYPAFFDLVVADAPCSGEGMFRKDNPALAEWSEENVRLCAARQAQILDNAAAIVKDGGLLLYSTCTYATEENEETVDAFLKRHPEFFITDVCEVILPYTSPGVRVHTGMAEGIEKCRRFYPHRSPGEGQFVALLRKGQTGARPTPQRKDPSAPPTRATAECIADFLKENTVGIDSARVRMVGASPVWIAEGVVLPPHSVFSAGVLLGEVRGKLLFPHHQFFSAFGSCFRRRVDLTRGDERLYRYLHGEEISAPISDGWCVVTIDGICIGGGKAVQGKIKNHYPKGLRLKS